MVAEIATDLRALDHEVWLDQDLGGGQDWWDEILARIRSCDAFVPVLSTASLASRACAGERTYAVALHRPVLPVAVGNLGPEGLLDEDLARRQRVAYQVGHKQSTLQLLAAVLRLPASPPLPAQEPPSPPAPMAYLGALRAELDGGTFIDFDRQLVLLGRLSAEAEDADRYSDIVALVRIFLARPEIAAYVERQLGQLQQRLTVDGTRPGNVVSDGSRSTVAPAAARQAGPSIISPGRQTRAVVVEDGSKLLVLTIITQVVPGDPNASEKWTLRVDRSADPAQAVSLDGRLLAFVVDLDRWHDDHHKLTVVRIRHRYMGTYRVQVQVAGAIVFEEKYPHLFWGN